jgi:uncharacterized coiled-coil protein SlyX
MCQPIKAPARMSPVRDSVSHSLPLITYHYSRITIPLLVLCCLALCSTLQAVTPAPDGGYPGGNTAEGQNALLSLTTGVYNTALGFNALYRNTTGVENTAVGFDALYNTTTGYYNTASGYQALFSNTDGFKNTADGFQALYSNTTGFDNTSVGLDALFHNTTGNSNTSTGYFALFSNTTGFQNTADGASALFHNTTGISNVAVGNEALLFNTTGGGNTAIGFDALFSNTGSSNVAVGNEALYYNTTGGGNTAIGGGALDSNTTGSGNIALGGGAGHNVTTANNVICIGNIGQNGDNSCYIANIFGQTSSGGTAVFINSDGKLGTTTSSRRFKEEIKPMERASEALLALKPVTFRYKKGIDPQGIPQFGLVAEEVEKINPNLVVRDADGEPYSVRYEAVNAMLLNEFLKEHRTVQELKSTVAKQEAIIAQQQKGMEAFAAHLKEQDSKIQKVTAQLELTKPAWQTVLNNQ